MNRNDGDHIRTDTMRSVSSSGVGTGIVNSVDQMVKLPLQMTGATWDFMMRGMRNMTGTGRQERTAETNAMPTVSMPSVTKPSALSSDDLGGDDIKYVTWSLIFTKPGHECVLEPPHSELVNYDADVPSFAAVKIAKFLDKARHGHAERAESWRDQNYPPDHSRTEVKSSESRTDVTSESSKPSKHSSNDRGWRVPGDDQKYIIFLHRVEWRLPKQEEVARVERVTIERGTTRIA